MQRLTCLVLFSLLGAGLGCNTTQPAEGPYADAQQYVPGSPFDTPQTPELKAPPTPDVPKQPAPAAERLAAAPPPRPAAPLTSPEFPNASVLLFSPNRGPATAADFAYRPPWPSVRRSYDDDDTMYYVQSVYDYEGLWGGGGGWGNQTIVRFRSYRVGEANRR